MKKLHWMMTVLFVAMMSFGADWYVSATTGSKKGDGSKEKPLKNIWKAIESAAPMDTIHVAEGNYHGKLACGWIEIDKPLTIIGGYAPDFSSRDIAAHQTLLRPTNEQNATKPPMDKGTLAVHYTQVYPNAVLVIDGLFLDHGDANSYHPTKGKPDGVDTGMWLEPPAKGNTPYASINGYMFNAIGPNQTGDVIIKNCVFLNSSNIALNLHHREGNVIIQNNLFINSRMIAANVLSDNAKNDMVTFDFSYNTVLFNWSRTSELSDMGYGVRANAKVISKIHHNILGLSIMSGFDNTKGDDKTKQLFLDNNMFFLNKKADASFTVSPSIKFLMVDDEAFEDIEDFTGVKSCEDNVSLKEAGAFKDVIDQAYLAAFLSANYSETTDFDPNSPANTFRELMGMNKVGTITTKVSMFCNRYPADKVCGFFGAIQGYGAQAIK